MFEREPNSEKLRELCRPAHANERARQSCVCIDVLVTAGTIPTVTCTLLYVQQEGPLLTRERPIFVSVTRRR